MMPATEERKNTSIDTVNTSDKHLSCIVNIYISFINHHHCKFDLIKLFPHLYFFPLPKFHGKKKERKCNFRWKLCHGFNFQL